jgi:hypothetical protein
MVSWLEAETLIDRRSHAGIRAVQHFTKCAARLAFRLAEQLSHFARNEFAEVQHVPVSSVDATNMVGLSRSGNAQLGEAPISGRGTMG